MVQKINQYYKNLGILIPPKEIDIIAKLATPVSFQKKDFLFQIDETNISIYFILKGVIRIFIKDTKQNEYNRFFAFDNCWIGEYHQILNSDLPSRTSAQVLQETHAFKLSKQDFNIIFEKCPVFSKVTLRQYLKKYADLLEKEEFKKILTIEELYLDLVNNHPIILDKIPLYHIASYLGVKPESLSRVKKKFKE